MCGKRNFLIFDPTGSGAADEVTDLVTQKNKLSSCPFFLLMCTVKKKHPRINYSYTNSFKVLLRLIFRAL